MQYSRPEPTADIFPTALHMYTRAYQVLEFYCCLCDNSLLPLPSCLDLLQGQ